MANKRSDKGKDYNGTYDGSTEKVMTRKMTDTSGDKTTVLVPESSKPGEAFQFLKHYEKALK